MAAAPSGPQRGPREVTPRGNLAEDEQATIQLFRSVNQSVVHITTTAIAHDYRMNPTEVPKSSGSGFVWDSKGYMVTNYHVIRDARTGDGKIKVVLYNSVTYPATVVGANAASDLAVLKINAPPRDSSRFPSESRPTCRWDRRCSPSAALSASTNP